MFFSAISAQNGPRIRLRRRTGARKERRARRRGWGTSRGHLGEHSQATARQQRCCYTSPSSSKYASPSAHSVRVHILSPPLYHSRRESARARRSVRPVKCVEALPPAAEVTFVGFGAKKSRQNKNFKSIVLNNKNTCTSRTKAQYHQTYPFYSDLHQFRIPGVFFYFFSARSTFSVFPLSIFFLFLSSHPTSSED